MEKYIKGFIEKLNERLGYRIDELEEKSGLASSWYAVKFVRGRARAVVFAELGRGQAGHTDEAAVRDSVIKQTEAYDADVVVVYTAERNDKDSIEAFIRSGNPGVLVDAVNNEVLYYHGVEEDAVRDIAVCASFMKAAGLGKKSREPITKLPVTASLIAVNVAVYAVTAFLSKDIVNSNTDVLVTLGAKVNSSIAAGEYWRLVTCMFLHGGIFHLAINMYSLYAVGPLIERFFGKWKYLAVYFISGICSSLLSFFMTPEISVGASGAIFGVLGACLVFGVEMKNRIGKDFMINVIAVIALNLFLGFSVAMIDNFGHIGGLIGGIVSSYILYKTKKQA